MGSVGGGRLSRSVGAFAGAVVTALLVHACGSRTGILTQGGSPDAAADGTVRKAICTPRSCATLGYNCGPNGDGCGNLLQCGFCPVPELCGHGGFSECGGGQGFGPDGGPLCTPDVRRPRTRLRPGAGRLWGRPPVRNLRLPGHLWRRGVA